MRFGIRVLGAGDSVALSGSGEFAADGSGETEVTDSGGGADPVQATARLIRNDVWMASPQLDGLRSGKRRPLLGTRCTHCRRTLDVATPLEHAGRGAASRFEGIARERSGRLPVDVCVASDGSPKLLLIEQTAPEGGLRVEIEFVEFGVAVDVEPPVASRVVEASNVPG